MSRAALIRSPDYDSREPATFRKAIRDEGIQVVERAKWFKLTAVDGVPTDEVDPGHAPAINRSLPPAASRPTALRTTVTSRSMSNGLGIRAREAERQIREEDEVPGRSWPLRGRLDPTEKEGSK
jgi:hypothetical protein